MKQTIILILIAFVILLAYAFIHRDFLDSPDAVTYADMARNIAEKGRPLTSVTLPQHFVYFEKPEAGLFWSQYPLFFPLMVALGFIFGGVRDLTVVLTSAFFYLATIPLVVLLSRMFFGTESAFLAGVFYIFNPAMVNAAVSGMTETLFAFQVTLIFLLLTFKRVLPMILAGAVLATAFLTRYQGQLLALPLLVFVPILFGRLKFKAPLATLTGFLLVLMIFEVIFPGTISHYLVASRYFRDISLGLGTYFGLEISSSLERIDSSIVLFNWQVLGKKVVINLYRLVKEGLLFGGPLLAVFYFLSLFERGQSKAEKFKWFFLVTLAIFLVSSLVFIFDWRFVWPLIPVMAIFAAQTFKKTVSSLVSTRRVTLVIFIVGVVFLGGVFLTSNANGTYLLRVASDNFNEPTIHKIIARKVSEEIPDGYVVASDDAAHIAWYDRKRTVQLPRTIADLVTVDSYYQKVDAVVVTDYPQGEWKSSWLTLLENPRDFGNFHFVKQFTIDAGDNFYNWPVRGVIYLREKI